MTDSTRNPDEPYLIISADTHAGLPTAEYRPYLDPAYREAFDGFLAKQDAMAEARREFGLQNEEFAEEWFGEHEEELRAGWDAGRRDRELDADGVAGEVIFPDADAVAAGTQAPFGAGLGMAGPGDDPELALAGARAHNRWLAGLCQESPDRRRGVIVAPVVGDVAGAVAEIRRAHADGLRGGVMIPSVWGHGQPPYHDRRYDPLWAVCTELGLPVHTHVGAAPRDELGAYLGLYITEVGWWSARPLWFLIWTGVFERHPDLRFGVTEAGVWWAGNLLWQMDVAFDREHGTRKLASFGEHMTMRPSEYFDRNCFLGMSTPKRRELSQRYEVGVRNLLWGNDFPHPEGTWPHTREWLVHAFSDVPVDETRAMLGLSAAENYAFDVARLRPLADRIGPRPSDLGQDKADTSIWDQAREAGRHWLSGPDVPAVVGAARRGGNP
ncbi:amidohydrolase family protein [Actinomadura rupiterrae]|uniref:amidohydrolase family protein n=1 Tax=Actinomadura rupiterrae TaxID=559627 RepID=UPI0020A5619D|nr:amidohydrolase family protein [Actinomadura rupiterrae]MCP2337047.1 putative TIM-barrel fold metal-dependent hydrolase [Actinomadura rupiterrae]